MSPTSLLLSTAGFLYTSNICFYPYFILFLLHSVRVTMETLCSLYCDAYKKATKEKKKTKKQKHHALLFLLFYSILCINKKMAAETRKKKNKKHFALFVFCLSLDTVIYPSLFLYIYTYIYIYMIYIH